MPATTSKRSIIHNSFFINILASCWHTGIIRAS
uniref:Uncharacterized protein n=1 Tax=Anguilla anguilla TaxID=7936 RepID=A0A0E9Q0I2_ANGAN